MTQPDTDSPLAPSEAHLQRIRERAYHLWEADGRPDGQHAEYWERARELDAMSSHPGAGLMSPDQPVFTDEAALEENLGEFPDRVADQGDRKVAPMTRDAMLSSVKSDQSGTARGGG